MNENQLYFVSVANNRSLRKNKADFPIYVTHNCKFCIFYSISDTSLVGCLTYVRLDLIEPSADVSKKGR